MITRVRKLVLPALAGLLALLSVSSASACILSNQSSLSANGYTAVKNLGTASTSASFVPFVFQRVYGRSQTIRFAENFNDLKKSLGAASLSHPFDQARVTIVPPGEVWRDNLGYTALDVVGFIMHWVFWIGATVLLAIIAYGFWEDWRGRRIAPKRAPAGPESPALPHA